MFHKILKCFSMHLIIISDTNRSKLKSENETIILIIDTIIQLNKTKVAYTNQ